MDWTRAGLKTQAKQFLKTRYWYSILVILITFAIVGGGSSVINGMSSFSTSLSDLATWTSSASNSPLVAGSLALMGIFSLAIPLLTFAFLLLVAGPVQIGLNRWFIRTRAGEAPSKVAHLFGSFKKGSYGRTVGSYAWLQLWTILWSIPYSVLIVPAILILYYFLIDGLLSFMHEIAVRTGQSLDPAWFPNVGSMLGNLGIRVPSNAVLLGVCAIFLALAVVALIPLIYKQISYSLTTWILADNPRIGYKRALKLSMAMTKGNVLGIFVLGLSFLGWYLLSILPICCCFPFGPLLLSPYVRATDSELYATLKHGAILRGETTPEELGYAPAPDLGTAPGQEGPSA